MAIALSQATGRRALSNLPGTLSALHLDVTDQFSILATVRSVASSHGHLDALINNAGVGIIDSQDLRTRLHECLEINAIGSALVADAFRPLLFKSSNPYSIYVSSGADSFERNLRGPKQDQMKHLLEDSAYQVSKAAQNMVAVREHVVHGPQGLKVFVMSPGCVVSNLGGTGKDERNAWGMAGDPDVAGETILKIVLGERDKDIGRFVVKDGLYPW